MPPGNTDRETGGRSSGGGRVAAWGAAGRPAVAGPLLAAGSRPTGSAFTPHGLPGAKEQPGSRPDAYTADVSRRRLTSYGTEIRAAEAAALGSDPAEPDPVASPGPPPSPRRLASPGRLDDGSLDDGS